MKKLLIVTLLTLASIQAFAGSRLVRVCDQHNNCQTITVYEQDYQRQNPNNGLMDNISNSGANNYNQYQRNYQRSYQNQQYNQQYNQ